MSILTSSPYSLTYNTLVVAKAAAMNNIGWSDYSLPNPAGAYI